MLTQHLACTIEWMAVPKAGNQVRGGTGVGEAAAGARRVPGQ